MSPEDASSSISPEDLARHQNEQEAKDKAKLAALTALLCPICGTPVASGATCPVDGLVAP